MKKNKQTRRQFIKKSAGAAAGLIAAPYIVPSKVFSRNNPFIPSEKITLGFIGTGWMGTSNLEVFLYEPHVQVVAVCDVDADHLQDGKYMVDRRYDNEDCKTYHDYRELLLRDDIDAVVVCTPDHWHAIPVIAAARAGKDIYCEKPLSHTLLEGRAMCNAVKEKNLIWQTGSWQRSVPQFRFACELVRNGRIGKVHTVEVGLPDGHTDFEGTKGEEDFIDPPKVLDYNFWLGPAPYASYAPARVHKNWRWILDYGGGQLMDWIGHHGDIAHWGLDLDNTGPVEIDGHGEYPAKGLWNAATKFRIDTVYSNGVKMIIAGGHSDICDGSTGTKWIGDKGWVHVSRGFLKTFPESLMNEIIGRDETVLFKSPGHQRNFIDCVKSREQTITPCEVAHRSTTPGHLGQISMLLGRKINFNPDTEKIINDETASQMLGKEYRDPWHL